MRSIQPRSLSGPVDVMKTMDPWFVGLWLAHVAVVVAASAIYRFHILYLVANVWTFFVLQVLVFAARNGVITDNLGRTEKIVRPGRFWARMVLWLAGTAFAYLLPIGFALQERS